MAIIDPKDIDPKLVEWWAGLKAQSAKEQGSASVRCEGVQARAEAREERQKRKGKPKGYEAPAKPSEGLYVLLAVGIVAAIGCYALREAAPRQLSWLDRNWRWAVACALAAPCAALAAYFYWTILKQILV